jgi:ubiquinone/menaquinone biosynthesis C-methylase UbiE
MSNPISSPSQISTIAYGFIGSQALFAALDLGVFDALEDGPFALPELARKLGVTERRTQYLATALVSLGLLDLQEERYANPPVVAQLLVRGAPHDFGDYLRYQIGRQMYPAMAHIGDVLQGRLADIPFASYGDSTGPAAALAKRVDLSACRRLVDIGGGSGAFTIALCERYPELSVDLVDFPNVLERTRGVIAAAGLSDRVRLVPGDATESEAEAWVHEPADVALMSYLLSGVARDSVPGLFRRAFAALRPGGQLLVHDFLLDDDLRGPRLAALWALQHLAFTPDGAVLTPASLGVLLQESGFRVTSVEPLIPGLTQLLRAVLP